MFINFKTGCLQLIEFLNNQMNISLNKTKNRAQKPSLLTYSRTETDITSEQRVKTDVHIRLSDANLQCSANLKPS